MALGEGDGPIDEDWGWVKIQFADQGDRDWLAKRTGPVTARIVEHSRPGETQRLGDELIFDATPLFSAPTDPEERKRFVGTYRCILVSKGGGYGPSWFLDGPHPGEEAYQALRRSLAATGIDLWRHSGSGYLIGDDGVLGLYASIAAPSDCPPTAIAAALQASMADFDNELSWLDLAEAAGLDTARHQTLIDRFDLD